MYNQTPLKKKTKQNLYGLIGNKISSTIDYLWNSSTIFPYKKTMEFFENWFHCLFTQAGITGNILKSTNPVIIMLHFKKEIARRIQLG